MNWFLLECGCGFFQAMEYVLPHVLQNRKIVNLNMSYTDKTENKKITMKKIMFLMFSIMGTVCSVYAQIYHSGVCYYIPAGENLTSSTDVRVVKFTGSRVVLVSASRSTICSNLQDNRYYYEEKLEKDAENPNNGYKYNSSLSTTSKEVYYDKWTSWPPRWVPDMWGGHNVYDELGYWYRAFSKDLKEMIFWKETKSGNIVDKMYFIRISEEDLKPKAVNRDFLE